MEASANTAARVTQGDRESRAVAQRGHSLPIRGFLRPHDDIA
jgi:hypothetical protein